MNELLTAAVFAAAVTVVGGIVVALIKWPTERRLADAALINAAVAMAVAGGKKVEQPVPDGVLRAAAVAHLEICPITDEQLRAALHAT